MILTGQEILRQIKDGRITIDPFDPNLLNPNSYNYRLGGLLKIAPDHVLDARQEQSWLGVEIPEEGFVLEPHRIYLGHTIETIGSNSFVTSLIGRSSIGRLGLYLQLSADLGQLGAIHKWTLELNVVQPLRLYSGMILGQVTFWTPTGDITLYDGPYGRSSVPLERQGID